MVAGHQPITTGEQRGVESGVGRSDGLHTASAIGTGLRGFPLQN